MWYSERKSNPSLFILVSKDAVAILIWLSFVKNKNPSASQFWLLIQMLVIALQALVQIPTKGAFRLGQGLQDGFGLLAHGSC